jgi:hypothetical protein
MTPRSDQLAARRKARTAAPPPAFGRLRVGLRAEVLATVSDRSWSGPCCLTAREDALSSNGHSDRED